MKGLRMSADLVVRLIGMVVFAIIGTYYGAQLGQSAIASGVKANFSIEEYSFLIGLVGVLFGLILTPFFTTRPVRAAKKWLTGISAGALSSALIGMISGLIVAALLAFPLSLLPAPFGTILPIGGAVLFGYLGVSVFVLRQNDINSLIQSIGKIPLGKQLSKLSSPVERILLLDTSVIIDGRITDISRTGFLPGRMMIPKFVLNELQFIADSSDILRRQRGRRGLDVLAAIQKDDSLGVQILEEDVEGVKEVDEKLILLGKKLHATILTNDFNLNKIAGLQGISVLNINDLANSVKSIMLPGETLAIRVIQTGKEHNQGVGYLDDGTMVVVENGKEYLDKDILVTVTKILQTAAGRMIFARPEERSGSNHKE
jgi:uncharacterized protein YacL